MQINLLHLMDNQACYDLLRQIRWADGIQCPHCNHLETVKDGFADVEGYRQRYKCCNCERRFDDLTDTVFSGSKKPLKTWIVCLYLMGLNISNTQIAKELELLGSHGMQAHQYAPMLELISAGKLQPKRLIGKTVTLEQSLSDLEKMGQFKGIGITVIDRF